MEHLAGTTLEAVVWLVARPEGGAVATRASGETVSGDLVPDVASARRASSRLAAAVPATWTPKGGGPVPVQVLAIPGVDGLVGLERPEFDARLGGAIENLVNQVAHDVRNFSFAIGLQAELGERRATTPDVKGHFAAVLRQIDALKRFLDRLLLYGRPARLEVGDVALDALVREAVRRLQFGREASAPPVSVAVDVDEGVGTARWDATAIATVLDSLLDNAVRSADPAPPVKLEVAEDGDRIRITIADRGRGILPQDLGRLSIPMTVRRPGGAGLGLAIARKLVVAHRGVLEIDSTGAGTTVVVRLPREVPAG